MTAAKHTPGKWGVHGHMGREVRTSRGGDLIATVEGHELAADRSFTCRDRLANARLIAAAPQLLDALERCLALLDVERVAEAAHGLGLVPARQHARAAIAAARGES